ncbi:hypothetical protein HOV23_gp093 [Pseudomonas phage Lana]|uniref:Uncharacterized protein n=1 Tax=Pseudomonas phage Lana TaxID=2530172 RepID=A0A481W6V0_9CAUD|nr:hypothetical protein HOV23_gp093 [Pseudomonas phage Lana]QBJ04480.1 hypothetical protein [Pseudomonas phage Lana]
MKFYINDSTQKVVETSTSFSDVHKLYDTKEEPEAILLSPSYLAQLADSVAKGGPMPNRQQWQRIAELLECLTEVHKELDKAEWDSDTAQGIAELLCAHGMPVRDIDDNQLECVWCGQAHHHDDCPEKVQTEV